MPAGRDRAAAAGAVCRGGPLAAAVARTPSPVLWVPNTVIDLAELPDASQCCGFGGTFAVKNTAVSAAMLADKTAAIRTTGAGFCAAADASCPLHIGGGLSRLGAAVRTRHIAEILASTR